MEVEVSRQRFDFYNRLLTTSNSVGALDSCPRYVCHRASSNAGDCDTTTADLSTGWFSAKLGDAHVVGFTTTRIGLGQLAECYRVDLQYGPDKKDGPATVVLKIASASDQNRQTSRLFKLYEREITFYKEFAALVNGPVCPCYNSSYHEDDTFSLLLADVAPAVEGDDLHGVTYEQAKMAMAALGRMHSPSIGNKSVRQALQPFPPVAVDQATMSQLYAEFLRRFKDRVDPNHLLVCQKLVDCVDAYNAQQSRPGTIMGLMHGDYRSDNTLFDANDSERPCTVVDWQFAAWGPLMNDVAYFLGCSVRSEDRRDWMDELLQLYHQQLSPDGSATIDRIKEDLRSHSFYGVFITLGGTAYVEPTQRSEDLYMTMLSRSCSLVLDLDALDTVPRSIEPT